MDVLDLFVLGEVIALLAGALGGYWVAQGK